MNNAVFVLVNRLELNVLYYMSNGRVADAR